MPPDLDAGAAVEDRVEPDDAALTDADTLFQQYFRTGMTRRTLGYSNPKLDEILEAEHAGKKDAATVPTEKSVFEAAKALCSGGL